MTLDKINKQIKENPLSKEECKAQFIEKTEELGLKHSFDFDFFGYFFLEKKEFFHDAVLIDVEIKESKMQKFLEKNSKLFEIINHITIFPRILCSKTGIRYMIIGHA